MLVRRLSFCMCLGLMLASASGHSDGPACITICNQQYMGTVKRCQAIKAQNGRSDYYADCIKNAGFFRRTCLRGCSLPR